MRIFTSRKNQARRTPPQEATAADLTSPAAGYQVDNILHLQHTLGNQAMLRLLRARPGASEPCQDPFLPLRSEGTPLAPATRERMEELLGFPLEKVRLHADSEAARSAEALGAAAYTVGRDIVLGHEGAVNNDTLLAHELGHAVRQGLGQASPAVTLPWSTPGDAVEREAASGRKPVPMSEPVTVAGAWKKDLEAVWKRFVTARDSNKTSQAIAAAEELIDNTHVDQKAWAAHGVDLALWLLDHGRGDLAQRALRATETNWLLNAALKDGKVPVPDLLVATPDDPMKLLERAKTAARSDQHDLAFRLFSLAFWFLQMQLEALSEHRESALARSASVASMFRDLTYKTVQGIYDRMREILGFYRILAREAREAGNDDLARSRARLAVSLAGKLEKDSAWPGEVMTGEFTKVNTAQGSGLRLHGANRAETDLTQLPGLRPPDEAKGQIHWRSLEDVRVTLGRQADLLAELQDDPEVRREFGATSIDMNDPAQRLRVWSAMVRSRSRRGKAPSSPLSDLVMLIGRYLKAFTRHSQLNIRDFGTSYLDSTLPTDLAGRVVQDCGVYALTVAWEVFKTARDTKLGKIDFELVFSPDHVVLVLRSADETFVVSNDHIVPVTGDPGRDIAKQFASEPGRGSVTFGRRVPLGSTDLAEKEFRRTAWDTYVKGGVSFKPEPLREAGDTRSKAERVAATAARYYDIQRQFDEGQEAVRAALDALDAERAAGNEAGVLSRRLPELAEAGRELAGLFLEISRYGKGLPGGITIWHAMGQPPLVRIALLLLRQADLGKTLNEKDALLIRFSADAYGAAEVRKHPRFPKP